ncbi:MAG: ABC transporter substrate-binding protein [Candidatus Acidiferrales bacterium]
MTNCTAKVVSAFAAAVLLLVIPLQGQEGTTGVTDTSIQMGSCSALAGPASFLGMQSQIGALAYFHIVNAGGGVYGRKIEVLTSDDGYDPENAVACFNRLVKQGIFAMGFFVGAPTAAKYMPMAEAEKIPLVGIFTGAETVYEPFRHEIITVRASYFEESREQVDSLWEARGIRKIGVIHQDDAAGHIVLEGILRAISRHQATPVAVGSFPHNSLEVDQAIKTVREADPEAVIMAGPYAPLAAILKRAHASGWHPLFLSLSFAGTEALIRAAGNDAEGVIITQVVPPYDRTDLPTIKLYRDALDKYMGGMAPAFVSLEGFVDAMVVTEGLRRAGKDLTREKFISGIESIHDQDMGLGPKFLLNYGPKRHRGFDSVYATIIRGGRAVTIADWKNLPTQ